MRGLHPVIDSWLRAVGFVSGLALALSACGSGSSGNSAQSHVSTVAGIIQQFDASHPGGLNQTGAACGQAADKLRADNPASALRSASARQTREAGALMRGVLAAQAGFRDCREAASSLNYARMVQAESEIESANNWIAAARRLEH